MILIVGQGQLELNPTDAEVKNNEWIKSFKRKWTKFTLTTRSVDDRRTLVDWSHEYR